MLLETPCGISTWHKGSQMQYCIFLNEHAHLHFFSSFKTYSHIISNLDICLKSPLFPGFETETFGTSDRRSITPQLSSTQV